MKRWSEQVPFRHPVRDVRCRSLEPLSPEWRERMAEREKTAYEEGRVAGEKALSEQLVRQRAELMELQNGVINSLRLSIPKVIREVEPMLINLALETAAKLVEGMPITTEVVETSVRGTLNQLETHTHLTVFLHPDDLRMLQDARSPLLLPDGEFEEIRFLASPDVSRGGCLVETRFGTFDGRRETKLALIRQELER